jgi:hypothetical protein
VDREREERDSVAAGQKKSQAESSEVKRSVQFTNWRALPYDVIVVASARIDIY